jgi:hypothetical protein
MGDFKDFPNFDRPSLECLVSVLDNYGRDEDSKDEEGITITELVLANVHLKEPSDGGVNVFKAFFTRSDTTLTKVTLQWSDFGSQQDTSQLIAAFETNRTVTDLSILGIRDLYGSALGSSLSGLMRNMPQLQRLECRLLSVEEVRAFQPGLQANQKLKELSFHCCYNMGDEGIRLIADALVGNTTMDTLDICENRITPVGLDDITRLIESTQLQKVTLWCRRETFTTIFNDEAATKRFLTALQHKSSSLQELRKISGIDEFLAVTAATIKNSLTRIRQLNRVNLLLLTSPPLLPTSRLHCSQ